MEDEGDMERPVLTNRLFDELKLGDAASLTRVIGPDDIELFAALSGDNNPVPLGQSLIPAGVISAVLDTRLPGPARSISVRIWSSGRRSRPATGSPRP